MRVILDTNVLLSAILAFARPESAIDEIVDSAVRGTYALLTPEEVIDELVAARSKKPSLIRAIPEGELYQFIRLLRTIAEIIPRQREPIPAVLRDPKDNFLLTAAAIGNADYLVTGDRDLLDIRDQLTQPQILTVAEFLALLQAIEQ